MARAPAGAEEEGEMAIKAKKQSAIGQQARGMDEWVTLYQAHNAIFKATELALLPENLTLPQLQVLSILNQDRGILTTGEIGRAMVKASQTVTGLVDRLEVQGLVERKFDRSDRRKVWVQLTTKGQRKWKEAMPVASRLAEEIFSVLTDEELRELNAITDKVRTVAMGRLNEALGARRY
jgi:MarR family 2-MHQ and catechol resistance regulon transcriptional repressor